MPLTELSVKQAKTRNKNYKLSDSKGLYLLVTTNGTKCWRLKYRFAGKEKVLALGVYPVISLKQARLDSDAARFDLNKGIDPSQAKQLHKAKLKESQTNSFQAVAMEWLNRTKTHLAVITAEKRLGILEKNLFPTIGSIPISDLKPPHIFKALKRIESRGVVETAHRARQIAGQIFRYAVTIGLIESDPTRDLDGALTPKKTRHHAALTDPKEVGNLMLAIEQYQGTPIVCALLTISPLLFQRPGELRQMEWKEIDFDKCQWEIPAHKMKMREPHIVPLSKQAIAILKDIEPLTSWGNYVFPNESKRKTPVSDGTVPKALRSMGYGNSQMTAHGFRAMARTILDEVLEFPPHLIEQQISHSVRDPLGRAYNRTSHLPQRKKMMQVWADYLDSLRAVARGKNVVMLARGNI